MLTEASDRGLALERMLLARAGRSRDEEDRIASHFTLPCREDGTSITEDQFRKMMDDFYYVKGWNETDGWPREEILTKLDLSECIPALEEFQAKREEESRLDK